MNAVRAAFPRFIEPCLPTLRAVAPSGPEWIHEIKFDGYRLQLHGCAGATRCLTRNGYNWTSRFQSITAAADALPVREFVIDAEAVVLDANGLPEMVMLRSSLAAGRGERFTALAFDLLYLDGCDLSRRPCLSTSNFFGICWSGPPTPYATANT